MEVSVEHLGDVQFKISAREHTIDCDQPVEGGGADEGMTPPELFLASLGSCVGYYAAQYLRNHKLATEGTRVYVTAEKLRNPARLDNLQVMVEAPVALNDEQLNGVNQAAHKCLIHNTLMNKPTVQIQVVPNNLLDAAQTTEDAVN
jgi:uncharacterized OsmC-like protein